MQLDNDYKNMSLSEGTLRDADLIDRFAEFLRNNYKTGYYNVAAEYPELDQYDSAEELVKYDVLDAEELSELVGMLIWELNEIAPKGCYFGAHIGDGASFGFWEVTEEQDSDTEGNEKITIELTRNELRVLLEVLDYEMNQRQTLSTSSWDYQLTNGDIVDLDSLFTELSEALRKAGHKN